MEIYTYDNFLLLWIGIMAFVSSLANLKVKENVLGVEKERYNWIFAIIVFLPIFLLASIWEVRNDVWQYLASFDIFDADIGYIFSHWSSYETGQGFYIIEAIIKKFFGDNRDAFRIIVALIQSVPLVYVLRKYSDNYVFSIFLFITLGIYNGWMMNGLRQFIAACLIFGSIKLLINKKYIPLIIIILLASTIHQSAIIMIPIVLICNFNPFSKKVWLLTGVLSVILYLYVENSNLISEELLANDDGANPLRVLFSALPLFLVYWKREKIVKDNNRLVNICIVMSMVTLFVYFIAMLTSGIMTGRLPIYTQLYLLILLPYILNEYLDDNERRIVYTLVIIFMIICFEIELNF